MSQLEGTQKFRCTFEITLMNIIEKTDGIKATKKIVLIKIGNSSIKCQNLNDVYVLTTQCIYSKQSSKFQPLKGIIKIYDITAQNNQIISCVGAFNTDNLLFLEGSQKKIKKDIGPVILEFKIKTFVEKTSCMGSTQNQFSDNRGESLTESQRVISNQTQSLASKKSIQEQEGGDKYTYLMQKQITEKILTIQSQELMSSKKNNQCQKLDIISSITSSNLFEQKQQKSPLIFHQSAYGNKVNAEQSKASKSQQNKIKIQDFTKYQSKKIQTIDKIQNNEDKKNSTIFNDKKISMEQSSINNNSVEASMSSLTFHELYDECQRNQMSLIGEQLVAERRNNKILQERIEKSQLKIQSLKRKINNSQDFFQIWSNICYNFISSLAVDNYGEYLIQSSNKKGTITLKMSSNTEKAEQTFIQLLNFISKNIKNYPNHKADHKSGNKSITEQIQNVYEQNIRLKSQANDNHETLLLFKKKYESIQKQLAYLTNELNEKNQQIFALELKQAQTNDNLKAIQGMNTYLKQKDQQMQYIISTKQNTIDNLRKMLTSANNELDELQDENIHLKKTLRNCELMIEQFKEEIANRDDTLQMYQQKYGAIKFQKNRELENQINDCLRWLNQQSKIVEDSLQQTQRSDITVKKDRTLASIVKNNEKLYGLGFEEVQKIKEQLNGIIAQVNQFQQKIEEEQALKQNIISQKSGLLE